MTKYDIFPSKYCFLLIICYCIFCIVMEVGKPITFSTTDHIDILTSTIGLIASEILEKNRVGF